MARGLQRTVERGFDPKVEPAVLKYGRAFIGINRPKGYRQRAAKNCYLNSFYLADAERGVYVDGFSLLPDQGLLFRHAWITLDGIHAVDVTLRHPAPECHFFGIPFSLEILSAEVVARQGLLPLARSA